MGGADDRPHVSGVGDPVQVDGEVAAGLAPAPPVHPHDPGARAQRADGVEELGLHVLAPHQHELGRDPGGLRGLDEVLALRDEQAAALALAARAQLPDQLQLLVVGTGDQFIARENKTGGSPFAIRPGGRELCGWLSGRGGLPG